MKVLVCRLRILNNQFMSVNTKLSENYNSYRKNFYDFSKHDVRLKLIKQYDGLPSWKKNSTWGRIGNLNQWKHEKKEFVAFLPLVNKT